MRLELLGEDAGGAVVTKCVVADPAASEVGQEVQVGVAEGSGLGACVVAVGEVTSGVTSPTEVPGKLGELT